MNKTIWIVNKHSRPLEFETHFRYIKYAQYLKELGHDVKIFCSSYMHNVGLDLLDSNSNWQEQTYDGLQYVLIKTLPYKGNGIKRMYSLFQFTNRVMKLVKKFDKPDIIIHTSNTPFTNKLCSFAKKHKAQYIVEILDLWPESFVSFGLLSAGNPLMKLAYRMEKWLYSNANNIIFSMEGGRDYIIEKKWDQQFNSGPVDLSKVLYINNSVDLSDFKTIRSSNDFKADYLDKADIFKVLYIGSISLANNVKALVEAAELLLDNTRIQFYIYGDGTNRDILEKYCMSRNIHNVFFKERRIDYKYVPSLLSKSSLNILNFQQSDVEKYGGCQGKLFNYFASAKPICSNVKMGYCLINKHNLGIAQNFESSRDYADAILSLSELKETDYQRMCDRVGKVSEEYDFKIQVQKLLNIL